LQREVVVSHRIGRARNFHVQVTRVLEQFNMLMAEYVDLLDEHEATIKPPAEDVRTSMRALATSLERLAAS
jgi:hypothetical protein